MMRIVAQDLVDLTVVERGVQPAGQPFGASAGAPAASAARWLRMDDSTLAAANRTERGNSG